MRCRSDTILKAPLPHRCPENDEHVHFSERHRIQAATAIRRNARPYDNVLETIGGHRSIRLNG